MNEKPNGLHMVLPWPDRRLNPNNRQHFMAEYAIKKEAKTTAFYLARLRGVFLDEDKHYRVDLLFCPPDKYHYDRDNLQASMKAALDGMCMGLGIDDRYIKPVSDIGPMVGKPGKVEVKITEMDESEWESEKTAY